MCKAKSSKSCHLESFLLLLGLYDVRGHLRSSHRTVAFMGGCQSENSWLKDVV